MIVTAVIAMEVIVVDFQSIPTTGVCLHESYIILLPYFACSVSLKLLDDILRFHFGSAGDWTPLFCFMARLEGEIPVCISV